MQLRPMTMDDADKMLEWKNYPETRQFAIKSHEEIKREDHLKWLESNVQFFQIVDFSFHGLNQSVIAGAIRIQDREVSIWIDRAFRNNGVATTILKDYTSRGMKAKIVDGNVASMKAFIKAGFVPIDHVDNYYILQKQ